MAGVVLRWLQALSQSKQLLRSHLIAFAYGFVDHPDDLRLNHKHLGRVAVEVLLILPHREQVHRPWPCQRFEVRTNDVRNAKGFLTSPLPFASECRLPPTYTTQRILQNRLHRIHMTCRSIPVEILSRDVIRDRSCFTIWYPQRFDRC